MFQPERIKHFILYLFFFISTDLLSGQDRIISGVVQDSTGIPVEAAVVRTVDLNHITVTDKKGLFNFSFKGNHIPFKIEILCVGYVKAEVEIPEGKDDIKLPPVVLKANFITPGAVSVTAFRKNGVNTLNIPVSTGFVIPSVTQGIEAVIKTLPGVSSYNELSSQYSVRGGSYDENLVYIDGIEIYRPYLIRYGQQEGLSQINPDFVSSITFSPGGFSALYGDRMSSVLDVNYRKPETFEASATASFLTSSAYTGMRSKNGRSYLMTGARYRRNTLLLNTLDDKGQFDPSFFDFQGYGGIQTGEHSQIKAMASASSNQFYFIPESESTTFGSIAGAYRFYALFEGCEKDRYSNLSGSLIYESGIGKTLTSRISLSGLTAYELESYDIRGAYSLDAIDDMQNTHLISDSTLNIGVGSWIEHARDRLRYNTLSLSYKGSFKADNLQSDWSLSSKIKETDIIINEWERVDSSGYTVGATINHPLITSFYNNTCDYQSLLSEAGISEKYSFIIGEADCSLSAGLRAFYDTFNNEFKLSPRVAIDFYLTRKLNLYLTGGLYRQPVGGRELMQFTPEEASRLTSQKSLHLASGMKYDFTAWNRQFRFTAELYGKFQHDLIPYKVENVRIEYFGGNIAKGYAMGLDMRINGEFVEGAESWFSLSIMKSAMEIPSRNTGWYPSPFDQRLNANIFFQDYLPGHPDFRAHINIVFGTGVPASPSNVETWDSFFRMPSYRRADIGFSKILIGETNNRHIGNPASHIRELSLCAEIFNLADIRNVISYTWIETVKNSQGLSGEFAVPNYLTRRRLNLRLTVRF